MKLSQSLHSWVRRLLVLMVILGFTGWVHPASVSAAVEYNEAIHFSDDFDSCSGERVLIHGTQYIVGRFTKDAAGRLHFGFTRNTRGSGIGQISGDTYILTDAVTRASLELVSGEVTTYNEQYSARLIRRGEEALNDDSFIHFLSKITITADGNVNTFVEIQSVACR